MTQVIDKIRVKGAAKQFKSGHAGLSGQARLERRVYALLVAARRLARNGPPSADTAYAANLAGVLQVFVSHPPAATP
jgi:hypothetical protein